jgi:hypothetical protein
MWWESAPPFILIGLAMAGMGHIQVKLDITPEAVTCLPIQPCRRADRLFITQSGGSKVRTDGCCCCCIMQGWIHQGFHGKPKAVCLDTYDRRLAKRDARIKEEERLKEEARTGKKKGWFS